jgi:hypothetical protein
MLWIVASTITRFKNCDFYLWGMLKEKVYMNNAHSLEELEANIRNEISAIPI